MLNGCTARMYTVMDVALTARAICCLLVLRFTDHIEKREIASFGEAGMVFFTHTNQWQLRALISTHPVR